MGIGGRLVIGNTSALKLIQRGRSDVFGTSGALSGLLGACIHCHELFDPALSRARRYNHFLGKSLSVPPLEKSQVPALQERAVGRGNAAQTDSVDLKH